MNYIYLSHPKIIINGRFWNRLFDSLFEMPKLLECLTSELSKFQSLVVLKKKNDLRVLAKHSFCFSKFWSEGKNQQVDTHNWCPSTCLMSVKTLFHQTVHPRAGPGDKRIGLQQC